MLRVVVVLSGWGYVEVRLLGCLCGASWRSRSLAVCFGGMCGGLGVIQCGKLRGSTCVVVLVGLGLVIECVCEAMCVLISCGRAGECNLGSWR